VGITAGSREVPGRNACDRRHNIIIIIMCGTTKLNTVKELISHSSILGPMFN